MGRDTVPQWPGSGEAQVGHLGAVWKLSKVGLRDVKTHQLAHRLGLQNESEGECQG